MLTNHQKACVLLHLQSIWTQLDTRAIPWDSLTQEGEAFLVGVLTDQPVSQGGQVVASRSSILGRVVVAYDALHPDTTDVTTYVKSAGSVTLNPGELANRKKVYDGQVRAMAVHLKLDPDRDYGVHGYPEDRGENLLPIGLWRS